MREFPRAKLEGTFEGVGLYMNVYLELRPNWGSISFLRSNMLMIFSLISMTSSPYPPLGVYCKKYPLLDGNRVKFYLQVCFKFMIF